jgi:gamma-glutamylcyclotransferase (GGCT)/AIG2-like uncharacterized protein YtfP
MTPSIVGYGTFITDGFWKKKSNVEVCTIQNYIRLFPKGSSFPYVLFSEGLSFKALKFDVKEQELKELDKYEGVGKDLFKRIETEILLKGKKVAKAFIYVPTETTIIKQKLKPELDKEDLWKKEIEKCAELRKIFPDLF